MDASAAQRRPYQPDGLVARWFPGDGVGYCQRGRVFDHSGRGNHGTWYGVPALYFDGGTDCASLEYDPAFGQAVFSLGLWLRLDNLNTDQSIYVDGFGNGSEDHRILLRSHTTGRLEVVCKPAIGEELAYAVTATGVVQAATWHAVLFTINAATRRLSLWVDGVARIDNVLLSPTWTAATWDNTDLVQFLGIDNVTQGTPNPLAGKITGVRIHGGATGPGLAAARGMYHSPLGMAEFAWSDYWRCNIANGNPVSNGGRTLTLDGVTWDVGANLGQGWRWDGANADSFQGGARWFDGTDDFLDAGAPADLAMEPRTNAYSLVLWIHLKSTAPSCFVMAKGGSNGLYVSSSSGLNAFAGGTQTTPGTGDIRGGLRQIAVTVPAASTGLQCYCNGAPVGSAGNIGTTGTAGQPLRVGGSAGYWVTGQVLRAEFYNRVLTAAEIKALYERGPYG